MKKKERVILIIIASLVFLYIAISVIVSHINLNKNTIYLGTGTRIYIRNNQFVISDKDIKIDKQNVKIYFNKKIIDGYVLTEEESSTGYDNNLHAYSNDGEYLSFYSSLIAYTKDLKVKFLNIENENIDNISLIKNYLVQDDIDINKIQLDYLTVSTFDLDNDDELELIYSLGLINNNEYDTIVVMLKDDDYYLLSQESSEYINDEDVTRLELFGIMDFNNDNNYEFVLIKTVSEYSSNNYELYNFDGNDFIKIGIEE